MKQILSIAFAFALAGTLLSGCDRGSDANRPAGSGGTASQSGGATSPSQQQQKQKSPTTPGGATGSGSSTGSK